MKNYRKLYIALAWGLILLGAVVAVVNFLTVVGIVFGILMMGVGIFILWSMRRPTTTAEETPDAPRTPSS